MKTADFAKHNISAKTTDLLTSWNALSDGQSHSELILFKKRPSPNTVLATGQLYVKFSPMENVSIVATGNTNIQRAAFAEKPYGEPAKRIDY